MFNLFLSKDSYKTQKKHLDKLVYGCKKNPKIDPKTQNNLKPETFLISNRPKQVKLRHITPTINSSHLMELIDTKIDLFHVLN